VHGFQTAGIRLEDLNTIGIVNVFSILELMKQQDAKLRADQEVSRCYET
jgi:hypothetical protein